MLAIGKPQFAICSYHSSSSGDFVTSTRFLDVMMTAPAMLLTTRPNISKGSTRHAGSTLNKLRLKASLQQQSHIQYLVHNFSHVWSINPSKSSTVTCSIWYLLASFFLSELLSLCIIILMILMILLCNNSSKYLKMRDILSWMRVGNLLIDTEDQYS